MKRSLISLLFVFLFVTSFVFSSTLISFAKVDNMDNFSAKSLFLMDYNTGYVMYEKNADAKMPVASIVKLMTIDLTLDEIESGRLSLDEKVVASNNASSMGGSQVFIEEGGEYSISDLLKSAIVSSANDASVALAERIAGSEENFVSLMNEKAKVLGLKNTNYSNSTGLPAPNQFSTARDTAILLKDVSSRDIYHKFSTIWLDTLKHPKGRESELVNTNKLIRYYEGCDGGKTGSTAEAGYCLSATAKRGDMRLIGVVLGAENGKARFAETSKLLNYGFNNFENKMIIDSSKPINEKAKILSGKEKEVEVKPKENLYIITKKREENKDISTTYRLLETQAPIKVGDKVGEIYVLKDDIVICQTDLISTKNVDKATMIDNINKVVNFFKIS